MSRRSVNREIFEAKMQSILEVTPERKIAILATSPYRRHQKEFAEVGKTVNKMKGLIKQQNAEAGTQEPSDVQL